MQGRKWKCWVDTFLGNVEQGMLFGDLAPLFIKTFFTFTDIYPKDTEAKQERKTSMHTTCLLQEKLFISEFTNNWDI